MNGIEKVVHIFRNQTALAKKLGVSKQAVNSWVHGTKEIPPFRAIQIERLTCGKVTIDDLISVPQAKHSI